MKFTTRIIVLFLGLFLFSSTFIIYFVYDANLKILTQEITNRLEDQTFHTMDKIDRMLYERYTEMTVLAEDSVISSKNSDPGQISEKLKEYLKQSWMYASLSFFDMNRVRIADTTGGRLGEQHKLEDYWIDISNGKTFAVDIHQSTSLGKPVFHFAYVVRDKEGKSLGVVVARMYADYLYDILKKAGGLTLGIHENEKGVMVDLVNADGLILYSTYNQEGILTDISPDWKFMRQIIEKGEKTGSVVHSYLHEEEISTITSEMGYLDFKGNNWKLIMCISTKEAFAPAVRLRNKLTVIFLISGIIILCGIVLFSRRLTKPIIILHKASIEIGKGNLDKKIDIVSKDEIGQLAISFNEMTSDLKKFKETLLVHSSELENKVKERTSELERINDQLQIELMERQKIEEVLLQLKSTAEVASQAKTEFISNMSHELRTPLNSILGFSEVLHDETYGSLNEQQKGFVEHVRNSGNYLLSLINDLLDLSKVEAGMMQLTLSSFLLKGVLRSTVIMLREKANRHGIDVSINMEPDADIHIEADERKIKQIMFNLLSNALKYTPDGGSVRVTARLSNNVGATRWVAHEEERVAQEEGRGTASPLQTNFIEISVADTGIGIKAENISSLFQAFTQIDNEYTRKYKGTGLGLALTRQLVELHSGKINVESAYEQGSTFTFTIPVNTGLYNMECRETVSEH
jgi:signal transduction histidine kinase